MKPSQRIKEIFDKNKGKEMAKGTNVMDIYTMAIVEYLDQQYEKEYEYNKQIKDILQKINNKIPEKPACNNHRKYCGWGLCINCGKI